MSHPFIPQCKSQLTLCVRYYLAFENELALLATAEIEEKILKYHRRLESSPRSHPDRLTILCRLAGVQSQRFILLKQRSDLDKAITNSTEAVLLSSAQRIVFTLFNLAGLLLSRYASYTQPGDIKSSIKYLRFLRISFYSLEAFDIAQTNGDLPTLLFHALALNLELTPGEMVQDLEEMVSLIPKFITANTLEYHRKKAIHAFGTAVNALETEIFRREDTRPIGDRAIQVLREASVLNPDQDIADALAMCLTSRFETTRMMNDCEEAITNFDRVIGTYSPGNDLTPVEISAIMLILGLLVSRVNLSPTPENLEDAIHRLRTFVSYPLGDEYHTRLTEVLNAFTQTRFKYFGVAGSSGGTPSDPSIEKIPFFYLGQSPGSKIVSQIQEKMNRLGDFMIAIMNGDNVEAAVEASRKLIPLQQSSDQLSQLSELDYGFANVLWSAYQATERLDYLNEAITRYRDHYEASAALDLMHFRVGCGLRVTLSARFGLLHLPQDLDELMRLCSELANDDSGEVFTRFEISCYWAANARANLRPSASIAYETAMSLLQKTLVFCPTLQTQHHRLANALRYGGRFPSEYASYQIQNGQVKQAIETLEQGRALIWSEMRGLRASADRLRAADPALADKFSDVNQRLESVTMSVAQGDDDDEMGRTGAGRENTISHLVLTQRRLMEERNNLITRIQSLPGFEHFLKLPSFDFLNAAASHGPVIIVNQSRSPFPSHVILLLKNSRPFIILTPSGFDDRAIQLENELLRVRKEKGLDSKDYALTLASVLSGLYELVGKRVIERLRKFKVQEKSRVWWCPTGAFCSLPLHAMGPIPSDDGKDLYFSDLYITSYTPTLSALIESQKRGTSSDASDHLKPSILLVAQPETLPGAFGEMKAIEATKTPVKTLISAMATPEAVIEGLRDHRFAHFVCHGSLEAGKPFDASLELHKDNLTLLAIVRSQLPAAEFAFLSACHTAELTEGSVADEGLHLAAAMQYCGFRSVVGTMWAMADTDGEDLSKHFYKALFADKADQIGVPYYERTARALQIAVKKLRKKRGVTLERWVNFVHYGA